MTWGTQRRSGCGFLAAVIFGCLALSFPALIVDPSPDESGFLLVARHWDPASDNMYGFYWVDRPPALIGVFAIADLLGGSLAARGLSALFAVIMLMAVYGAGAIIGGISAARWATLAAAALLTNPLMNAWAAKSESFGVPLVALSCWLALAALKKTTGIAAAVLAAGAGAAGVLALGMKQNLAAGLVFGAVLLLASLFHGRLDWRSGLRLAGAALAGAAVPFALLVLWTQWAGVPLSTVWDMTYGFRSDAFGRIIDDPAGAPLSRAGRLIGLVAWSGLGALIGWFLVSWRSAWRVDRSITAALSAMLLVETVGIALGGSYWSAYLIALFPVASLAVALLYAARGRAQRWTRWLVLATVAATLFALGGFAVGQLQDTPERTGYAAGRAIQSVAHDGDTIVNLYGNPDVVLGSGLSSPYRQLWSLPMRTLDPDLGELKSVLGSPQAPAWLVQRMPLNAWQIDAQGELRTLIRERYVLVSKRCDGRIWLRADLERPHPASSNNCD